MKMPFFSVVIPTHNRLFFLNRAIDSVLQQTFKNLELIVVDDYSTDDTPKICKVISDQRFKYLLNERTKGACGARNTGIFNAKGTWVAFLDDDDEWSLEKLKLQFDLIINSDRQTGLVCSDYLIYKDLKKKPNLSKNRPTGWVHDEIISGGLLGKSIGCLSSTCVKKDLLLKIGGFDEAFRSCQDQDLWLRISEIAKFASIPKPLVNMYQENRKRIGTDYSSKLDGYVMLRNKYANKIEKNFKLKHRYESRIFIYSLLLKKKKLAKSSLLWFLFGSIVDFPQFFFTMRLAILHVYRSRKKFLNSSWR